MLSVHPIPLWSSLNIRICFYNYMLNTGLRDLPGLSCKWSFYLQEGFAQVMFKGASCTILKLIADMSAFRMIHVQLVPFSGPQALTNQDEVNPSRLSILRRRFFESTHITMEGLSMESLQDSCKVRCPSYVFHLQPTSLLRFASWHHHC